MKKYILYAEDDLDDFEVLKQAFAEVNEAIELMHVTNGYDVIKYLQNLEPSQYPSLILMDINMPLLNGKETLELLKTDDRFKSIPVKVFSTSYNPADKKLIEQSGSEIINKPSLYDDWLKIATDLAKYCAVLLLYSLVR